MKKYSKKELEKKLNSEKKYKIIAFMLILILAMITFIKFKTPQNNEKITYIPINYSFYSIENLEKTTFKTIQFSIEDLSMTPCINNPKTIGVMISYTKDIILRQGDIVAYQNENESYYVVHRIIRINDLGYKKEYIIKGDANKYAEKIDDNQIKYILGELIFPILKKEE